MLSHGKLADITEVDRDLLIAPTDEVKDVKVLGSVDSSFMWRTAFFVATVAPIYLKVSNITGTHWDELIERQWSMEAGLRFCFCGALSSESRSTGWHSLTAKERASTLLF